MKACVCEPAEVAGYPFILWMGQVFSDCVYSPLDQAAVYLGFVNIFFWAICLFPQLYKNYVNKEVGGLSLSFLIAWLLGGFSNLLGCILTNQLPTQLYTAIYFCVSDVVIISQYYYYSKLYRQPHYQSIKVAPSSLTEDDEPSSENISKSFARTNVSAYLAPVTLIFLLFGLHFFSYPAPSHSLSVNERTLLAFNGSDDSSDYYYPDDDLPLCNSPIELNLAAEIAGYAIAWLCGFIYFFSRVPQIIRNYRRQSVEGLALGMFFCAIMANTCYGLQIILRFPEVDLKFWGATLPYIIGSMGTLVWDLTIFYQAWVYKADVFFS
eukprot:Lithocolla_globosa_v1_NODE_986_length_2986_cov_12.865575.p1 type:complete len:323 gc:universal NODE_986_length_2986_cov_12.865575:1832-2800(+)